MISEEYIFQTVNTVLYEIWDPCGPGCPPDEYYAYDAAINFIIHKDNNRWSADCEKQISDYLQEQYEVPKKVMDAAEIYVASTAQQMAQNKQQQSPDGQTIDGIPAPPIPGPGSPAPVPQGGA